MGWDDPDPTAPDPGDSPDSGFDPLASIKKLAGGIGSSISGALSPPPAPKPAFDADKWLPIAEQHFGKNSPEAQYIKNIGETINRIPVAEEYSPMHKLAQIGFTGLGAGLMRAGGDVGAPRAVTEAYINDWRNQENQARESQTGRLNSVLQNVAPATAAAMTRAQQLRVAEAQLRAHGINAPPIGAPPGWQGSGGGAPGVAPPQPVAPGQTPQAQPPAAGQPPAGGAPPQAQPPPQQRPADNWEPVVAPGQPPLEQRTGQLFGQPMRWHFAENKAQADAYAIEGASVGPSGAASPQGQGAGATAMMSTQQKIAALRQQDQEQYERLPQYGAWKSVVEGTVKQNQDLFKGYQTASIAARNNDATLQMLNQAFEESRKRGNLGVGAGSDFFTTANQLLERVGAPHLDTSAVSTINELANRAGVESAQEEANGSGRGAGQRIMLQFLKAVPSSKLTEGGFQSASAAVAAINEYHNARQRIAEEFFKDPGNYTRTDAQSEIERHVQPYFDRAVQAATEAMRGGMQDGGKAGARPPALTTPALAPEQQSTILQMWQTGTPEQRAQIEESLRARGLDPQAVIRGQGTAPHAAAHPRTSAPPPAGESQPTEGPNSSLGWARGIGRFIQGGAETMRKAAEYVNPREKPAPNPAEPQAIERIRRMRQQDDRRDQY